MASIKSPVKGFGGEVVGVQFKDGSATCTDEAKLNYFERQGYTVTGRPAPKADEAPDEDGPLKGKALDEALEAAGLSKTGSAEEKRARLAEHEAAQQEPDGDQSDEGDSQE